MLYNFTFLLSSLFFFFLKIWSEIGIRIIQGPALYTGKYSISFLSNEKKKSVFTVYSIPRRETCVATLYILLRILQEILWDLTRI